LRTASTNSFHSIHLINFVSASFTIIHRCSVDLSTIAGGGLALARRAPSPHIMAAFRHIDAWTFFQSASSRPTVYTAVCISCYSKWCSDYTDHIAVIVRLFSPASRRLQILRDTMHRRNRRPPAMFCQSYKIPTAGPRHRQILPLTACGLQRVYYQRFFLFETLVPGWLLSLTPGCCHVYNRSSYKDHTRCGVGVLKPRGWLFKRSPLYGTRSLGKLPASLLGQSHQFEPETAIANVAFFKRHYSVIGRRPLHRSGFDWSRISGTEADQTPRVMVLNNRGTQRMESCGDVSTHRCVLRSPVLLENVIHAEIFRPDIAIVEVKNVFFTPANIAWSPRNARLYYKIQSYSEIPL